MSVHVVFLFILYALLAVSSDVQAHTSPTAHLSCSTISAQTDMIQATIGFHKNLPDSFCTTWDDDYPFNGAPPPAQPGCFPDDSQNPFPTPYPVTYKVLTTPSATQFDPTQGTQEGNLSCSYNIFCKPTCDPPWEPPSSVCNDDCNISILGGACGGYGGNQQFTITTTADPVTVSWDDTQSSQYTSPQAPGTFITNHAYQYPGKYDVLLQCGTQVCHKRFQMECRPAQDGGPTPTSLPTATPTPTTWPALCEEGLFCLHPCACDSSSQSYTDVGCTGDLSSDIANVNLNTGGGSPSNVDGGVCAPGLVCCSPPPTPPSAWFKTKDASYHENGALTNDIPSDATAFNQADDGPCNRNDPSSLACHGINVPGLLTAEGVINLNEGRPNIFEWEYGDAAYTLSNTYTPDSFIQFTRAKKESVTIDDPENVQQNKINYLVGPETITTIDDNGMGGKAPFVLMVDDGDLIFDLPSQFNPANHAMAIVVDGTIQIKSTITSMNGIFIANDFDFAYDLAVDTTTTNELEINGNVVSMNDSDCLEKRQRSDGTKPTCFFTHDFVNQYLPLIDLFSIRTFSRSSY